MQGKHLRGLMIDNPPPLKERIRGSIYGLLIGDALGCPVEGCHPDEILVIFGRITQMEEPKKSPFVPKAYIPTMVNRPWPCVMPSCTTQQLLTKNSLVFCSHSIEPHCPYRKKSFFLWSSSGPWKELPGYHQGSGQSSLCHAMWTTLKRQWKRDADSTSGHLFP